MQDFRSELVSWDTETHLIASGNQTPPIVCHMFASFSDGDDVHTIETPGLRRKNGLLSKLLLARDGLAHFLHLLQHTDAIFIGVNLCYDLGVLLNDVMQRYGQDEFDRVFSLILDVMEARRFSDLMIRERLLNFWNGISHLPCDMDGIVSRRLKLDISKIKKGDSWRLKYNQLDSVPLELWPQEAIDYCHSDAILPLLAFLKQLESAEEKRYTDPEYPHLIRTETWELQAQLALYTATCWGITCDPVRAKALFEKADVAFRKYQNDMVAKGLAQWDTVKGVPTYKERRAAIQNAIKEAYLQKFINDHPGEGWSRIDGVWTTKDGDTVSEVWLPQMKKLTKAEIAKRLSSGTVEAEIPKAESQPFQQVYAFRGVIITPVGEPSDTYPQGQISYGREVQADSDDPDLEAIASEGEWKKIQQTYVPIIQKGVRAVINPRFNGLGAITTRTSSSWPNLQNIPTFADVRETMVARPGYVLCSIDTAQAELVAWGVWCKRMFGVSDMLDMINGGVDVHCYTSTRLPEAMERAWSDWKLIKKLTKSGDHDDLVLAKKLRQFSKIYNFSRPGGGGAGSILNAAKRQGIAMTLPQAEDGIRAFDESFRESKMAARWAGQQTAFGGARYTCDISGVSIGDRLYTQLRNITFQSRVAQFTKQVCIDLLRRMFCDRKSALYGSRIWAMVHDEIILEIPYDADPARATAAVREAEELFQKSGAIWLPGAIVAAEGGIARAWVKNKRQGTEITPVWKNGILVPCDE